MFVQLMYAGRNWMDLTIVVALIMIAAGVFRLYLVRSGKLPLAIGVQRFFPWIFIGTGVVFLVLALTD
jgi:hypothetical protein